MQLAYTPGAIIFAVHNFPHMSKVEPGTAQPQPEPAQPKHEIKLTLQNSSAYHHPVYILCLYLLLIYLFSQPFVMSFLIFLSHP